MARLFLASFTAFFAWMTVYWFAIAALPFEGDSVASALSLAAALAAGGFTLTRVSLTEGSLLASVLRNALTFGAVAFAVGFFGPFLVNPEANLGPLIGIFVTGPLGFLVGGTVGFFRGLTAP
jgi:hypothetical protein